MKVVAAKCKFCQRVLELKIADDYANIGDRFNLIALAACNRCADYYAARRMLFEKIRKASLTLLSGVVKKDDKPKMREIMVALVKRYMRLLAEFRDVPIPDFDEAIVDDLMSKPGNYSLVIDQIPKMLEAPKLI